MAIDSAIKRKSAMGWGDAWDIGIVPSGTVSAGERATFLDLYSGIALGGITFGDELYCVTYGFIDAQDTITIGAIGGDTVTTGTIVATNVTYGFIDSQDTITIGEMGGDEVTVGVIDC